MTQGEAGVDRRADSESGSEMKAGDSTSVQVLRRGIATAFLATLFISRKLWLSTRDYPLTPVWHRIPQPHYPLDHILFWAMAVALIGVAAFPNRRGALKIACAISILFNHQFATDVFPWLVEPLQRMIHVDLNHLRGGWETAMALSAAAAEEMGGLLLLFPRTRRAAVFFLIAMHCFVLVMIGPFGSKWNQVVWPWKIAMAIALWALFWRRETGPWPAPNLLGLAWWREARSRSPRMVAAGYPSRTWWS